MDWPTQDKALAEYVREQQRIALETYVVNPDLLEEHVRQEASFRVGGYGERQVSELLQNAVDALTQSGSQGRVEFRIADGALYCANEGVPFDRAGIRAVSYAFLSPKRDGAIGRFGLGFKSVLGITDRPQIFSRSVSFEFNAPETAELFAGASSESGELPLLRVPSLIDLDNNVDPHVRQLMNWASTVVKLPLVSGGARIRRELLDFETQTLLFMKSVDALTITLQDGEGALPVRDHRRQGDPGSETVVLHTPGQKPVAWLFAERHHEIPTAVFVSLTDTAKRKSMTVSYAVPLDGSAEVGRFWAWFPLQDRTTARGIFNAPWQVNDDRTSMLVNSALNGVLLDVCAELFLDVAIRASTPDDPAAHLDLFPARGREVRSAADRVLSNRIPELARSRTIIPDTQGVLQLPSHFRGVPELNEPNIPAAQMQAWQAVVERTNIPHWKCFTTNTRTTRLRALLRQEEGKSSPSETNASAWLEELAHLRTPDSLLSALEIHLALRASGFRGDALNDTRLIPVRAGMWERAGSTSSVLLRVPGQPVPDGLSLVDEALGAIPEIRSLLRKIGFSEVSPDQTASALASTVRSSWGEENWDRFWESMARASAPAAVSAIRSIRDRGLDVMVKTRIGSWRRAVEVFAKDDIAQSLDERHIDYDFHARRGDLIKAAGSLDEPAADFKLWEEEIYSEYRAHIKASIARDLHAGGHSAQRIVIPDIVGAGPLQLFHELRDDHPSLARWTRAVIGTARETSTIVPVQLTGSAPTADFVAIGPEWWAAHRFGLVLTSLGHVKLSAAVDFALHEYSAFIPVADSDTSFYLDSPRTLKLLGNKALMRFLAREGYAVTKIKPLVDLLVECTGRTSIPTPELMPAVLGGSVVLKRPAEVVFAISDDDAKLLEDHGVAHLIGTAEELAVLSESWGLQSSAEALSRSLEIREEGEAVPLLDRFPSLESRSRMPLAKIRLRTSAGIIRKTASPAGLRETRLPSARLDDVVIVEDSLDDLRVLMQVSIQLGLGLTAPDMNDVLLADEAMRRNVLVEQARLAPSDPARLLILVGSLALRGLLPEGLLAAIEGKRGRQSDLEVAGLYLTVRGSDSVFALSDELRRLGLKVPAQWSGSARAQEFVFSLGFSTAYAGIKSVLRPQVTQVQGQIELNPLHPFQEDLAAKVRHLALVRRDNGDPQRGLMFLPTGAGKTRVSIEAVARMFLADELAGPVLWIAQSQELCEQAIQTWTDVWRAIGDERLIDICRFWGNYELDESNEELQVVVAVDDKLSSRIDSPDARQYNWLSQASLVIIDEAHTALSPTYTGILRWLGLTATKTERPLLGLTATPYRGRVAETNNRFVERFGRNKLESLDPDDPIGELRRARVLSEVDHEVLDGMQFLPVGSDVTEFRRMKEVTKSMLDRIGQDLDRTQTLVNDVLKRDESWPILIFAASVASAHTIAALLRLEGRQAAAVDGSMRGQERRRVVDQFRAGDLQILVNCDLLTQGFDAPKVRALYIARPTFSPNRYHQMIGRGLRGPENGGKERCLIVNIVDTFDEFGDSLAFTEFNYLWNKS